MLTAALLFPPANGASHGRSAYSVSADAVRPSTAGSSQSPPRGGVSVIVTDVTDARAKKDALCDMVAASREDLLRTVVIPLVESITPPALPHSDTSADDHHGSLMRASSGLPAHAQGTVVIDGSSAARANALLDAYDGLLVASIRELAKRPTTKAVFLSAVELDEHNQLIDLLAEDARSQRSASPHVALRAAVVRHQIPTIVEDTTDRFTAVEETTFEDVSSDCHPTLRYLATKCQSDSRHQIFSVVVMHRHGCNAPNTTMQFISLVVNEVTRGTRATRHCIQNAASLLESRSSAVSYTSTKVLFLLKPVLTGRQPGAWVALLDPHGTCRAAGSRPGADGDVVEAPQESFKDAFTVLQTLSRVSGASRNGVAACLLWNNPTPSALPIYQPANDLTRGDSQVISSSVDTTGNAALDNTMRRASRLTEATDKRFQELMVAQPPSRRAATPPLASQRQRSSSTSSSELEPRNRHPTLTPITMMSRGHPRASTSTSNRAPSPPRRPAGTPSHDSHRNQAADDMRRRIAFLEQSEADATFVRGAKGTGTRGPTMIDPHALDGGVFVPSIVGHSSASKRGARAERRNEAARVKAARSPYKAMMTVAHVNGDAIPSEEDDENRNVMGGEQRSSSPTTIQRLKKELAKEKAHGANILHNYETYKHTMEGALQRLRRDLEAQTAKLDDTQKQLRQRDRVLRTGHDGHHVTARELESVTAKLRALEEQHHQALSDHSRQKSAWKAQRMELHKSNELLQTRVSDLLETINDLEGFVAKSQETATSRTRGLTMSATTMTTIAGLVNVTQEHAIQRIALDGGGGAFLAPGSHGANLSSSPHRHGQLSATAAGSGSGSLSAQSSFARKIHGGSSTPPPQPTAQVPTIGIPRGTQTTFPTFTQLQHELNEKDIRIEAQADELQRLTDNLAVMTSREHSLHQRIEELEMDVAALEEREIAVKSTLLKTEQLLRVERQDADRQRHHRALNVVSSGCQATPAPELQDILINDLEIANRDLHHQLDSVAKELEAARTKLVDVARDHTIAVAELEAAAESSRGALVRELEEQRAEHQVQTESLQERIYTLEQLHEEQQRLRSTNISPQSAGSASTSPNATDMGTVSGATYEVDVPNVYRGKTGPAAGRSPAGRVMISSASSPTGAASPVVSTNQRKAVRPAGVPLQHRAQPALHVPPPSPSATKPPPRGVSSSPQPRIRSESEDLLFASPNTQFNNYMARGGVGAASLPRAGGGGGILKSVPAASPQQRTGHAAPSPGGRTGGGGGGGILRR